MSFHTTDSPSAASSTAAWPVAAILLLCLAPFLPGLSGPFQLDDLTNLSRLRVGDVSLESLYHAVFSNTSGMLRRPLANATLLLQILAGAQAPFSFKLVNLLLHGLNGYLVWRLSTRLLPLLLPDRNAHKTTALLAAALWMVHPLQVSSVLYVVQRMTLLSSTFMLLALLLALRPLSAPQALVRHSDGFRHAVLVGLVSLAAVLCKENGVLVPFLLMALYLSVPDASRHLLTDSSGKRTFTGIAVWLPCIVAIALIAAMWSSLTAAYAQRPFSLIERMLTQPAVLGDYLLTTFLPLPSRMGLYLDDVTVVTTGSPYWLAGPLLLLAVIAGTSLARRRYPMVAFATFWFLASHLLESSFIPLELKYEHRNYLALLGPAMLVASAVIHLGKVYTARAATIGTIAVLALTAGSTLLRSLDWSNEARFVAAELRHHPDSVRVNLEVARLESAGGNNAAAVQRIMALQKSHPESYPPLSVSIELGCAGFPVNWDGIRNYIRQHPATPSIQNQALYAAVIGHLQRKACVPSFEAELTRHIEESIQTYTINKMGSGLQFFLMVKAQMQTDAVLRRELLRRAIAAQPDEIGPRVQLAYMDLAMGDQNAARETIGQLDRSVPAWHPDRMYVEELLQVQASAH